MSWLIALNSVLYIAAVVLFVAGYGILALICFVIAALLTLGLSGGKFNPFEFLD